MQPYYPSGARPVSPVLRNSGRRAEELKGTRQPAGDIRPTQIGAQEQPRAKNPPKRTSESPRHKPAPTPRTKPEQQDQQPARGTPPSKPALDAERQAAPGHESGRTILVPMRTPPEANVPVRVPEPAPPAAAPPPVNAPAVQAPPIVAPPPQRAPAARQPAPVPPRPPAPFLSNLSEDERAKLHSAHETALHDPNLAATRQRYLKARQEFRQRLRDALLKADPSVQPILEKIQREKPEEH